jgi:hypothetical protein
LMDATRYKPMATLLKAGIRHRLQVTDIQGPRRRRPRLPCVLTPWRVSRMTYRVRPCRSPRRARGLPAWPWPP